LKNIFRSLSNLKFLVLLLPLIFNLNIQGQITWINFLKIK